MVRKAIEEHEGGAHMKIEAAVTHGQGEEFKIGEVELAEPRSNEVLVRVVATGVCHTDAVAQMCIRDRSITMSIIVWIIIGGLAGWVAGMIMKEQGSLVKNIIVGIVGALIGGFIMSFFGAEGFTGFNLWSFVVALLGSVVLLAIINFVTKKSA